jgi:hypothetical protein
MVCVRPTLASFGTPREHDGMRHEPTSGYEDSSLNYRVTWRSVDEGGKTYERVFTSTDDGWDFKEDKERSANAYGVTWEHIPA